MEISDFESEFVMLYADFLIPRFIMGQLFNLLLFFFILNVKKYLDNLQVGMLMMNFKPMEKESTDITKIGIK